jgi:FdhD protein
MQKSLSRKLAKNINIMKYSNGSLKKDEVSLINEVKYNVFINSKKVLSIMLLPVFLEEFIYGFLFTSGFINSIDEVMNIRICDSNNFYVYINKKIELTSDFTAITGYSCGKLLACEAEAVIRLDSNLRINAADMDSYVEYIINESELCRYTHCAQTATFLNDDKRYSFDDIESCNAIDRIVGFNLLNKIGFNGVLILKDRITCDVVYKCIRAKIPVIITKSSQTFDATMLAKKANITLIGSAEVGTFNLYNDEAGRVNL